MIDDSFVQDCFPGLAHTSRGRWTIPGEAIPFLRDSGQQAGEQIISQPEHGEHSRVEPLLETTRTWRTSRMARRWTFNQGGMQTQRNQLRWPTAGGVKSTAMRQDATASPPPSMQPRQHTLGHIRSEACIKQM